MKYVCSICGYVYDDSAEGIPFSELSDSWVCPLCGAAKSLFSPQKNDRRLYHSGPHRSNGSSTCPHNCCAQHRGNASAYRRRTFRSVFESCPGMRETVQNEEAGLFREIAAYFAAVTPDEPDGDLTHLLSLFENDLTTGYPAVQSAAQTAGDRGTQRVCVWGQKVTVILNSLVQRYQREGSAFLRNTQIWSARYADLPM